MRKRNIFILLLLGALSLTSCAKKETPKTVIQGDASARPNEVIKNEYTPNKAPKDYEGKTLDDINNQDGGAFNAFFYAEHKLANSNFFTYISSSNVSAKLGGTVAYTQDVSGFRVFLDGKGFGQSITKKGNGGALGSLSSVKVSKAVQKYEDVDGIKFADRVNAKDQSIDVKQSENSTDGKYMVGTINDSDYGNVTPYNEQKDYVSTWGHNLWGLTSYYVPSSDAILKATVESYDSSSITLNYEFTTSKTAINGVDASSGYAKEQQQMVDSTGSAIKITINSLKAQVTLDSSFFPSEVHVTESYTASVGNALDIDVSTNIVNKFKVINSEDDISIPEYKISYLSGKNTFESI